MRNESLPIGSGSGKNIVLLVFQKGIVYTRHVCPDKNRALSSSWKQWPENKEKLLYAGQRTSWRTISCFYNTFD